MKWGSLPGDSRDLLFWVLWSAVGQYSDFGLDDLLARLLTLRNGLMGDPGWEFGYEENYAGSKLYSFSADKSFSGIVPEYRAYSVDVVRHAIKESLLALAEKYPAKSDEVAQLIVKYEL